MNTNLLLRIENSVFHEPGYFLGTAARDASSGPLKRQLTPDDFLRHPTPGGW